MREKETGKRTLKYSNASWLGAIGYMALLDMIGACFKPKSVTTINEKRDFVRALKYFNKNLSEDKMLSLYALRCALMHDFSLSNLQKKDKLRHHFVIEIGNNDNVVLLPQIIWDGKHDNKTEENKTVVNIEKFGDLVEEVCKKIRLLAQKKDLEIILPGGAEELISRYTSSQKINLKLKLSKYSKISIVNVKK